MVFVVYMPKKLSVPRPPHGARLVALRKAANLTQTELAALVGESQTNIAYWERIDRPPRSDVLPKLADALGVGVQDLLKLDALPAKRRSGPVGRVRQAFEEVPRLPRREQNKVVEFVFALVKNYSSKAG